LSFSSVVGSVAAYKCVAVVFLTVRIATTLSVLLKQAVVGASFSDLGTAAWIHFSLFFLRTATATAKVCTVDRGGNIIRGAHDDIFVTCDGICAAGDDVVTVAFLGLTA
jgi:hypothetical protein